MSSFACPMCSQPTGLPDLIVTQSVPSRVICRECAEKAWDGPPEPRQFGMSHWHKWLESQLSTLRPPHIDAYGNYHYGKRPT